MKGAEMGQLADYLAAKDAERGDGSVDWSKVPVRNGGTKITSHPADQRGSDNPQLDHLLSNLDD